MGKKYLIDTNTAIDYFGKLLPGHIVIAINSAATQISVVTRIELLCWSNLTPDEISMLKTFINSCIVHNLSEQIILKTIEIRKNLRLKLPDAIIAATSLVHDLSLLTRNVTDFNKVPGLNVINPHSL